MKNKGYITAIMLVSVLIATFIVRIFFIQNMMNKINVDEALLELAMLEENGIEIVRIFANGFSVKAAYVFCMSFSCMVFGNFTVAGVYLNVALQLLAVLMLFCAGKNFLNRTLGFVISAVFALLPAVVNQIAQVNETNMYLLFAMTAIWLVSAAVYFVRYLCGRRKAKTLLEKENAVNMEETEKTEKTAEEMPAVMADSSMKEIILDDTDEPKPNYIENPLPVPKRRTHKEMDYAIETDETDDYDITDMTGKDFFDIE